MPLNNFFKINLPYGIRRNEKGYWSAFNREYKPLGYNDSNAIIEDSEFSFTNYGKLSENLLLELADDRNSIKRNEKEEIVMVFLYNDSTNPSNQNSLSSSLWNQYFLKIKKLSNKKVKQ